MAPDTTTTRTEYETARESAFGHPGVTVLHRRWLVEDAPDPISMSARMDLRGADMEEQGYRPCVVIRTWRAQEPQCFLHRIIDRNTGNPSPRAQAKVEAASCLLSGRRSRVRAYSSLMAPVNLAWSRKMMAKAARYRLEATEVA